MGRWGISREDAMNKLSSRAPRNRTLSVSGREINELEKKILTLNKPATKKQVENKLICGDIFDVAEFLPDNFVDLLFVDPPYNLNKKFNNNSFREMESERYEQWLDSWLSKMTRLLKSSASVYICGDWKSSGAIFNAAQKYFIVRNRITFEREKGRGAKANWKNASEDIWFCTVSDNYTFNINDVKMKRKVLAPYRDEAGKPKDWEDTGNKGYRLTHPSNLWTDITIPFWSMPENTDHPTQKPEKLLAKIILASSNPGDMVFDPFCGSGTTAVTAKKLGRSYCGVEMDRDYSLMAQKRIELANEDKNIQGYSEGIFWERNSLK